MIFVHQTLAEHAVSEKVYERLLAIILIAELRGLLRGNGTTLMEKISCSYYTPEVQEVNFIISFWNLSPEMHISFFFYLALKSNSTFSRFPINLKPMRPQFRRGKTVVL